MVLNCFGWMWEEWDVWGGMQKGVEGGPARRTARPGSAARPAARPGSAARPASQTSKGLVLMLLLSGVRPGRYKKINTLKCFLTGIVNLDLKSDIDDRSSRSIAVGCCQDTA